MTRPGAGKQFLRNPQRGLRSVLVPLLLSGFILGAGGACGSGEGPQTTATLASCDRVTCERSYLFTNLAFRGLHSANNYRPLPHSPEEVSQHGLIFHTYLWLLFYYHETGVNLPYDKVIEFLSEEFESDGTVRLHNNGLHPEIYTHIEWFAQHRLDFGLNYLQDSFRGFTFDLWREYMSQLEALGIDYNTLPDRGAFPSGVGELSADALNALARLIADPNYSVDFGQLLVRGTHWDHLSPIYEEYLRRAGIDIDGLPAATNHEGVLTSSLDGLSIGMLYTLWRYYEGYDKILDLSQWHPQAEAED